MTLKVGAVTDLCMMPAHTTGDNAGQPFIQACERVISARFCRVSRLCWWIDLLRGGRAQVVQHGHLKAGVVRLTRGALDGERRADARQQQMMAPMLPQPG